MRIYFAHPISQYHTPFEQQVLENIPQNFEVVNPSNAAIAQAFNNYRAAYPNSYMNFFTELCSRCDGVVFTTFEDSLAAESVPSVGRRVGAGVQLEVDNFLARGAPVFYAYVRNGEFRLKQIDSWDGFTLLTVDQTRALLRASGRYDK